MNELENLSKIKAINKVNILKEEIEKLRPISKENEQRIFQKYRLDWNYHSNAIEGNSLNYGETIAFFMHGVTAKGKPLKDHLDLKGHNQAIDYLQDFIKNNEPFTEKDLRAFHQLLLSEPYEVDAVTSDGKPTKKLIQIGTYKTSPNHVKTRTGEIHFYATPEDTPIKMNELMVWLNENYKNSEIHPIVLAGIFHHKFVAIHPFDDGNGRMARLLMNLILMHKFYPPIVIKTETRNDYYSVLSMADAGNYLPFIDFLAENMVDSLNIYIKGAKGESLAEPTDFEKEIALFKMQVEGNPDKIELIKSPETLTDLIDSSILPFVQQLDLKLNNLKSLYLNYYNGIIYFNNSNWFYNVDSKINIENFVEEFKKTNLFDLGEIMLVFQFENFKNGTNSFGIELKLTFEFDKFKYKIWYNISKYNELENKNTDDFRILNNKILANNYYHQKLYANEINDFSNTIGIDLLNYTKQVYNNPNFFEVKTDFNLLLNKIGDELPFFIKEIFKKVEIEYLNQIFTLSLDKFKELKNYKTSIFNVLNKELKLNFNFELVIKDDLPF